ncbi:MAG: S-methyl-5-thioribose-1-phosphate isomerase [Pseudomonadota bacterium]
MKVGGKDYRTIWDEADGRVAIIDQTLLPHEFRIVHLATLADAEEAIRVMRVRGAPLIGATAAYGVWLALTADSSDAALAEATRTLGASRPTAVNLRWALERMQRVVSDVPLEQRAARALDVARRICDEDVALCSAIGDHGLELLRDAAARAPGRPVNVLTHCNAGWLATVDWGTALAPIYKAHDAGIDVHVWVDETRPRNQGAHLTAFELGGHGVAHTLIVDNAGGHLMQRGLVDLCIVGTDRTTANGDVANKIGTYLKALAAHDNRVPFYVAAPSPSIDWRLGDGLAGIPIEQRNAGEVSEIAGADASGRPGRVRICPPATAARNDAFDVTPARLVSGLITERGLCAASRESLGERFPDLAVTAAAV